MNSNSNAFLSNGTRMSVSQWIILGVCCGSAVHLFYKIYNKQSILTEEDEKSLDKYKYQLHAKVSVNSVKRTMAKFGDRHLIPYLFPGEAANQTIPKRRNRNKQTGKKSNFLGSAQWQEAKPINVDFPVDVFVRIRPLIHHEIEAKHATLQYIIKKSKKNGTKKLIVKKQTEQKRQQTFGGLNSIIRPKQNNQQTFELCIMPCIDSLFKGRMCAAFAYGHSGSGKTHTMFGYDTERGLHSLFAREVLDRLRGGEMYLQVRFVELYQNALRDLLSANKDEIMLQQSEKRGFVFRTHPSLCDDGKFRSYPITSVRVLSDEHLSKVLQGAIKSRAVGSSTIHDQSSRSHAFLEYEIVNKALIEARAELLEREADLLWYQLMNDEIKLKNIGKKGSWIDRAPQAFIDEMNSLDRWKVQYKIGEMEKLVDQFYLFKFPQILGRNVVMGKTMCFVDLAGNEYGRDAAKGQTGAKELKERVQINRDLMALKECIRALHGKNRKHIPYRQSMVTKYLKRYLGEEDAKAVMISTIGISQKMIKQSINTLKYTKLVANV
eukprot:161996_1